LQSYQAESLQGQDGKDSPAEDSIGLHLQHTAWTCQEIPLSNEVGNTAHVYRRRPLTVADKGGALILRLISGGGKRRGAVAVTIPKEIGIRLAMKVTPDRNRCVLCVDIRSHPGFHIANVKEDCPSMPAVTTGPGSGWRGPSCKRCYWLRRPCVWVPDTDLLSNERLKFIRIPHAYTWGAQDIQASHTQEMQEMGPTEEEIEDGQGDDINDDTDDDDA
jgi:hypothetical protein